MSVKPIPDGYSTVTPFMNLKDCNAALEFYKKAFGAEERFLMKDKAGMIMHGEMKIGNAILMISEATSNTPTQSSHMLYVENSDAWWKRATEAGCTVVMPLADQFWGDRYGLLQDKWGNRWAIATHTEDVPPAELDKRAAEWMKNAKP